MRRERVMVRFRAGPTWTKGPPEDQPDWAAHEVFIDDLVDRGIVVMGGPLTDMSGSLVLLENVSREVAQRVFEQDPFVKNEVFVFDGVHDWTVYVDTLTARDR